MSCAEFLIRLTGVGRVAQFEMNKYRIEMKSRPVLDSYLEEESIFCSSEDDIVRKYFSSEGISIRYYFLTFGVSCYRSLEELGQRVSYNYRL
jgi:hypothetical protein